MFRFWARHSTATSKQVKSIWIYRPIVLLTTTTPSAVVRSRAMEIRRHELRRSKTFSSFNVQPTNDVAAMTHRVQGPSPTTSPPLRTLVRAHSWAPLPFIDTTMSSSTSSMSMSSSPSPEPAAPAALRSRAQSSSASCSSSSASPAPSPTQFQSTFIPFVRGIIHSSLTYEALFALILSINIRELIGNGADAIVKALVKKAVTLTAALFIAMLLDCASPAMPLLGIDALEMEIRNAAGTISGWLGQQASDPIGWKLEKRIADWLWPKPISVPVSIVAAGKEGYPSPSGAYDTTYPAHSTTPSLLNGMLAIA